MISPGFVCSGGRKSIVLKAGWWVEVPVKKKPKKVDEDSFCLGLEASTCFVGDRVFLGSESLSLQTPLLGAVFEVDHSQTIRIPVEGKQNMVKDGVPSLNNPRKGNNSRKGNDSNVDNLKAEGIMFPNDAGYIAV